MQRILAPFGASAATFSAPAKVAPALMPTKIPSFCASSTLHLIPSAPGIWTIRSITFISTASDLSFGMKSGVQPCKSAGNELRILRFAEHDFGVWHFFREHACYALQCATSAIAGHPVVEV